VSAVILLGWLAAAITLSAMGIYHVTSGDRPTIQYGILLPILIGALMIWRSETTKRVIAAVPQQWLVGVQFYRALGAIFLVVYAAGKLPGPFPSAAGTSPSASRRTDERSDDLANIPPSGGSNEPCCPF
jgi:hypothetical protein